MPGSVCSPVARAEKKKPHEVRHHRLARGFRHSLREWFYGFLRGLPGDRAFLPPSPVRCASIVTRLIPASRYQDATTSPSATSAFVCCAVHVHRSPRPTFVTIGQTPLFIGHGMRENVLLICPTAQRRGLRQINTTGKSVAAAKNLSSGRRWPGLVMPGRIADANYGAQLRT